MLKKLLIMIAVCASLCMVMVGCGGMNMDSETTEEGSITDDLPVVEDQLWKGAYRDALQADEEAILQCSMNGNDGNGGIALSDLDGDGQPELLYFAFDETTMFPAMKIYTCWFGDAEQVSYEKKMACTDYADLPSDALYDYQVQGGTDYEVFMKEDGTLVMYSLLYGAENSPGMVNEYKMTDEHALEETCRFGFVDEFNSSMLETPADAAVHYWKDGSEVSKDEFDSLCEDACSGISELIFRNVRETDGRTDAQLLDATSSLAPVSMTYSEAMEELER